MNKHKGQDESVEDYMEMLISVVSNHAPELGSYLEECVEFADAHVSAAFAAEDELMDKYIWQIVKSSLSGETEAGAQLKKEIRRRQREDPDFKCKGHRIIGFIIARARLTSRTKRKNKLKKIEAKTLKIALGPTSKQLTLWRMRLRITS